MSATEQEKLASVTREAIREAMAEKEEADRLSKFEDLLNKADADVIVLTEALATKEEEAVSASTEQESLMAQLEELRAETEKLKDALAASSKDKEDLEERASKAETELAVIEAEKKISGRMVELEEVKVVKSGEKRTAQEDKVRGLSDEEFAAYKEELVDFRSEWEAEKAAAGEGAVSDGDDVSGDGAAAVLECARKEEAALAAAAELNIEVASDNMLSKYLSMAGQMANNMNSSQE